jgi:prepilin-type N-terminal cleavage/methylation domain-containing protein
MKMLQLKQKEPNGFTILELVICVSITLILLSISSSLLFGKSPYRMSDCVRSGGNWTEGTENGSPVALCTYGPGHGSTSPEN